VVLGSLDIDRTTQIALQQQLGRELPHRGEAPSAAVQRPAMEMFVDRLLDQRTAAEILGISVRTLERHRIAGTGPCFCRLGRLVRYRECDLDDWVSRSLRSSTSEIPESVRKTAKLTPKERMKQPPA
jgi:predicted DNA-binding transcriptional regulator AlpA